MSAPDQCKAEADRHELVGSGPQPPVGAGSVGREVHGDAAMPSGLARLRSDRAGHRMLLQVICIKEKPLRRIRTNHRTVTSHRRSVGHYDHVPGIGSFAAHPRRSKSAGRDDQRRPARRPSTRSARSRCSRRGAPVDAHWSATRIVSVQRRRRSSSVVASYGRPDDPHDFGDLRQLIGEGIGLPPDHADRPPRPGLGQTSHRDAG